MPPQAKAKILVPILVHFPSCSSLRKTPKQRERERIPDNLGWKKALWAELGEEIWQNSLAPAKVLYDPDQQKK